MKKRILTVIFGLGLMALLVLPWLTPVPAQAQCGNRYRQSVFSAYDSINVAYDSARNAGGALQVLRADVYSPQGDSLIKRPLIISLFGGSFVSGSRQDAAIVGFSQVAARHGYVAAGIDYRIGLAGLSVVEFQRAVYRAVQDARSAVVYFKRNGARFGIDTSQIFLGGVSAGAVTSIHAAYWQQNEVPITIDTNGLGPLTPRNATAALARPKAVIAAAGSIGDTLWLTGETTPVMMWHNTSDPTVPYGESNVFGNKNFGSFNIHRFFQRTRTAPSFLKTASIQGMHLPAWGSAEADTITAYWIRTLYQFVDCNMTVASAKSQASAVQARLWPNPARETVRLTLPAGHAATELMLVGLNGQTHKPSYKQLGSGELEINLAGLPAGVHWLKFNANGQAQTVQLLIQ